MSAKHCAQRPSLAQSLVVCMLAQSVFDKHCTHCELFTLQRGVSPEQPASLVQPCRHSKLSGEQIGAAVPQSAFDKH